MKHIIKRHSPKQYADWCKQVEGTENADYRNLHSNERGPLKQALLTEQGSLCGYTMKRIDMDSSHVEHIKPETICRAEKKGSDLDYQNMVACYPKEDLKRPYRYGAKEKDDWWDEDGKFFISPLSKTCETLLSFDLKGKVTAVNNDVSAKTTIDVLKLDHPTLTNERMNSIAEFIYGPDRRSPLSRAKAEVAISGILGRNENGNFIEFCVAIRCALLQYIRLLDTIAAKKKFAARDKKQ